MTFTPRFKKEPDRYFSLFKRWVTTSITIESLLLIRGCQTSANTLRRHFDTFLDQPPQTLKLTLRKPIHLKADGTYFGHWGCAIAFKTKGKIIYSDFVVRENYFNYCYSFSKLTELGYDILGLTSDWHGSLVSAFKSLFPDRPHQRCLVHTQLFSETLLTKNPETKAGRDLLLIVKQLNIITNHYERNIWIKWFERWEVRYQDFINQKTYLPDSKHWWYTHKNVRKVYRSLKTSLDHLFLYLDRPGLEKDTNGLEVEFNHLKQKLAVHKGLKHHRKVNLIKWYFFLKSHCKITQKPTRNEY